MSENNNGTDNAQAPVKAKKIIAFLLCMCILGGVTVFSIFNDRQRQAKMNEDAVTDTKLPVDGTEVSNPVPVSDSRTNDANDPLQNNDVIQQTEKEEPEEAEDDRCIMPIENSTISNKFSDNTLIYSETLDQFIVHPGADIDAPLDTPVMSVMDGTVIKVYEDDKYGMCVWISHREGVVTKYCNLSSEKMVGEGDDVKKGTVIGKVGNTSVFESLEPSHLHFEAEKDGVTIDPEELLC